jgi:hypothetical protein
MTDDIRVPLKAVAWEEAKGKLRALVALQGSYFGEVPENINRWKDLDKAVSEFIRHVEDYGLHE